MGFSTRRGRPPKAKEAKQAKPRRVSAQDQEVLDILHTKSLITDEELWAGLHLRWLYTLRFGAPGISAAEIEHFYGRELKLEDPVWQEAREKEYAKAITELRQIKAHKQIMDISIFNIAPNFLHDAASFKRQRLVVSNHQELGLVVNGFGLLCKLWGRDNSRYHRG